MAPLVPLAEIGHGLRQAVPEPKARVAAQNSVDSSVQRIRSASLHRTVRSDRTNVAPAAELALPKEAGLGAQLLSVWLLALRLLGLSVGSASLAAFCPPKPAVVTGVIRPPSCWCGFARNRQSASLTPLASGGHCSSRMPTNSSGAARNRRSYNPFASVDRLHPGWYH